MIKSFKLFYVLFAVLLATSNCYGFDQDILIYNDGNSFIMKGKVDGKILGRFENADDCIHAAIKSVANGGEIMFNRGEYLLTREINLFTNISLKGSGRSTKLIMGSTHNTGVAIMIKGADGVVVSDISIHGSNGAKTGVVVDDAGDCKLYNLFVGSFPEYGIVIRNNAFLCSISNCSAADNGKANYYFENLQARGRAGDYVPNAVNNCIAYGGGNGFETRHAIVLNLIGCSVFQAKGYGFYLHHGSNSVLISGCRTFQIEKDAVFVDNSAELNASSNIFCWHRGNGIVLDNVQWATLTANNIIDNGVRKRDGSFTNGIVIRNKSEGVQVTGNAIFNWGDQNPMEYGITEDETCSNNIMSNNNINYFTKDDILSKGKNSLNNHNVSIGDKAFKSMNMPPYPDFDTLRLETFIKNSGIKNQ